MRGESGGKQPFRVTPRDRNRLAMRAARTFTDVNYSNFLGKT